MTLYDLHCNACNAYFEAWQDRNAKGPFRCQKCGKQTGLPHDPHAAGLPRPLQPAPPAAGRGKGIGRKMNPANAEKPWPLGRDRQPSAVMSHALRPQEETRPEP